MRCGFSGIVTEPLEPFTDRGHPKFCGSRIPGTLEKAVVVVSCSVAFEVGDGVADEEQPIPKTMSIVDKPIIQNLFSHYLAFKLNPPD